MPDKVIIPFSSLEKDLLTFFESREQGLRIADVVEQFCGEYPDYRGPEIKAALWQLLAERYLQMTSDREISRHYPASRQTDEETAE